MVGRTDPAVEKSVRKQSSVGLRVCGNKETQREMQQDTEEIKSKTRFRRLDQKLQHGYDSQECCAALR